MRLDAHEFLRRFLLHVLPDGFQRIRHVGFLANGHRKAKLATIRRSLAVVIAATTAQPPDEASAIAASETATPCPCCGGPMIIIEFLPGPCHRRSPRLDTS